MEPVLIAVAGIAGLTLAAGLARRGIPAAVLECVAQWSGPIRIRDTLVRLTPSSVLVRQPRSSWQPSPGRGLATHTGDEALAGQAGPPPR